GTQPRFVEVDRFPVPMLEREESVTKGSEERVRLALARRVDGHDAELALGARADGGELELADDELERVADGEHRLGFFAADDRRFDDRVRESIEVLVPRLRVTFEGRARAARREIEVAVAGDDFVGVARADLTELAREVRVPFLDLGEETADEAPQAAHGLV